jgi:hypothetical protein
MSAKGKPKVKKLRKIRRDTVTKPPQKFVRNQVVTSNKPGPLNY